MERSFTRGSFGHVEWVEGSEGEQSEGVVCLGGGEYMGIWEGKRGKQAVWREKDDGSL
jgi:hypothetical protein